MAVQVVCFAEEDCSKINHHYAAYLTKSGDVILKGPFLNLGDAETVTNNIMNGKKSEPKVPLIVALLVLPFVFLPIYFLYREKYDEALVDMVASGIITEAIVIQNAPDTEDEIKRFAQSALKG